MATKLDAKLVLDKVRSEKQSDRKKVSLFLSESLYEDFKKACKPAPASPVMEELMRHFLESLKKGK